MARAGEDRRRDAPPSGDGHPAPAATPLAAPSASREGHATFKLQKVLAQAGVGSRRAMEALIARGGVTVNGQPAGTGTRVDPRYDVVAIGGRPVGVRQSSALPQVLLYHKPEGEIVSRDDPERRATVFESLPRLRQGRWLSIGRLDYNTSGLLMFTDSGELANALMHPGSGLEREYAVRVLGELAPGQAEQLLRGIELADGPARFDSIRDGGGEGVNHWYRVVVREGRNRLVRRLFEACNLTVSRLIRVRFGPVGLPPRLRRGLWVALEPSEVAALQSVVAAAPRGTGAFPAGERVARRSSEGTPEAESPGLARQPDVQADASAEASAVESSVATRRRVLGLPTGRVRAPGEGESRPRRSPVRPGGTRPPREATARDSRPRSNPGGDRDDRSRSAGPARSPSSPPRGRSGDPARGRDAGSAAAVRGGAAGRSFRPTAKGADAMRDARGPRPGSDRRGPGEGPRGAARTPTTPRRSSRPR